VTALRCKSPMAYRHGWFQGQTTMRNQKWEATQVRLIARQLNERYAEIMRLRRAGLHQEALKKLEAIRKS